MKTYQDTETGQLHAFDDGIDPFKLNNRNIPTTLSEAVIPQPSESHVWLNGDWIQDIDAPKGYKPPISSVPVYNPAWIAFLRPYTIVISDLDSKLAVSLEQINFNSYDGGMLSKAVSSFELTNHENLNALVTYDGAIAIPMNIDYPSVEIAIDKLNYILCAILLGGIHAEVLNHSELECGSLQNCREIFSYKHSLHSRLRHMDASISERLQPLMYPRTLLISELKSAYLHGVSVIDKINNFSPFFLLHGYSAMVYQNRSEALSSLWIVVEQLTSFLWENKFLANPKLHPIKKINKRFDALKDNRTYSTSVKHELLWQTKLLSEECFEALSIARQQRNKLVHDGTVPDFKVIENLWKNIHELIESTSGVSSIKMRQLAPFKAPEGELPKNYNFEEWKVLSNSL
jgi:hypothetical protein